VELFFKAIFLRLKKSGNVKPDPEGHAQNILSKINRAIPIAIGSKVAKFFLADLADKADFLIILICAICGKKNLVPLCLCGKTK
jgi:hypothetical protein